MAVYDRNLIYVRLTFDVTVIGGAYTRIINPTYWSEGIEGGPSLSELIQWMDIDGTQITPWYDYAFSTYGEHTVVVGYPSNLDGFFPYGLGPFHNLEHLVKVDNNLFEQYEGTTTPVGARYLYFEEFDNCINLHTLDWNSRGYTLDYNPVTHCPKLTNVTLVIPNTQSNNVVLDGWYRVVFGWANTYEISWDVKDNALLGSGITSLKFSNTNSRSIGENALQDTSNLKWIWLDTEYLPSIDPSTFRNVREGGVLYNPNNLDVSSWMSNSQYYLGLANWTVSNVAPSIVIDDTSKTVNYRDTDTHFVAVTSNIDYDVVCNSNKIQVTKVTGGFSYEWLDTNKSALNTKSVVVTVFNGNLQATITLIQDKKPLGTDFYMKPNKYVIPKDGGTYSLTFDWLNDGDVFDFVEEAQFTITPYSYWGRAEKDTRAMGNCAAYAGYFLYIPGTPVTYQIRKNQKTYQINLPAVGVDTYYKVTINVNTVGYDWYGWELTNWSWAFAQMGSEPEYKTDGDGDYRKKRVIYHCGGIWTSTRIHTSTNNKKLIAYDLYAEDLLNEVIQSNKESIISHYGTDSYVIDFTNETLRTYTNDAFVGHWIDITGEDFVISVGTEHNLSNPLLFTRFNTNETVNPVCNTTALRIGDDSIPYNTPNNAGVIGDLNSTYYPRIAPSAQYNYIGGGRYTISFTQIWEPTGSQTNYNWPIYLGMMSGPSIEFTVDNENAAAIIGSDRAMIGNSFLSVDVSDQGLDVFPNWVTSPAIGDVKTFQVNTDDYIITTELPYTISGDSFTVTVPPNTTIEPIDYYIGVSNGAETVYVRINQEGGKFDINPEDPFYGASGGNKTAQITTSLEYDHITISAPEWALNPSISDNTISFSLTPNYTTIIRTGDIVLTAYDSNNNVLFTKNWTIGQDCTRFDCMNAVYTDYRAKTIDLGLSISDNISLSMVTISESLDWVTPTLNITNSSFTIAVTVNGERNRRYGTITVTVKNPNTQATILTKEILIYQYSPMTDPIYNLTWYPIGTEAMFTVPTNNDYVDYTVLIKDKEDHILETYYGRAYREPDGYINVCMNDIVDNYLTSDLTEVFPSNPFSVIDNYRLTAEINTEYGDTETFVFMNSWVREPSMIPTDSLEPAMWWRGQLSEPISDKFDPRQYLVFSWNEFGLSPSYTINGNTTVLSADTGNPLQVFADKIISNHPVMFSDAANESFTYKPSCGDYALYYINAYGGWDCLLVKAKRIDNIQSYDYKKLRQFEKGRYLNVITPTWDVYTDYGVRSDRMHHLLESPTVYLHNLDTGDISKVLINETTCEYKNRFANYSFKLTACLNNYRR